MRIKPRQQLLDIWQEIARHSFDGGAEWIWGDRSGLSSVTDAEHLLCFMHPAAEIPAFRLDDPDTMDKDVERALRPAGGPQRVPGQLIAALTQFMDIYTAPDGSPVFAGGTSFVSQGGEQGGEQDIAPHQRALGVVDSFAKSVSLCLATLGFLKVYEERTSRAEARKAVARLREAADVRLTAAMVSLLRSFAVDVFDADSDQGRRLLRILGQDRLSERTAAGRFQSRFRALRSTITESLVLGIDVDERLKDDNQLFACGWSWGLVRGAPTVDIRSEAVAQPAGVADASPCPYFTTVALDHIQELSSDRTLTLGLLSAEQQKLAEALRLRYEVSAQYWSGVARFDTGRRPLEDIPWRTTGQRLESEYLSLSVAAVLIHDLVRRRAADDDLVRTVTVLEQLAERGRVTRRLIRGEPAAQVLALPLRGSGSRGGPPLRWRVTDFPAQLLERTLQLCRLSRDTTSHDRLLRLAELTVDHLWQRRITEGEGAGLWDDAGAVRPDGERPAEGLSWSLTQGVTRCLVVACDLAGQPVIRSAEMTVLARDLLSEATQLLVHEQMEPTPAVDGADGRALKNIEVRLRRVHEIADSQPGTACALALGVLGELDELARARAAASWEL